jgi:hypothetical protein
MVGAGKEKCVQDFGGKPEGKRLCGRSRCRWKDNVGMNFRK